MTESENDLIRVTAAASVVRIELNRPARGNAFSAPLVEALIAALDEASRNAAIDTVIFHGAGRNFCTGFDLDGIESQTDADLLMRFVRIETLLDLVWTSRLRTVAIGTGRIWGAGADLFAACDVRLARSDCRFRFPGAGFGIVLGTRRLSVRVGDGRARQWTTTGSEISAADALAAGLVTQTIDASDIIDDLIARLPSLTVDRDTLAGLHQASRRDDSDRDMALLVRSASRPGLKTRIVDYAAGRRTGRA